MDSACDLGGKLALPDSLNCLVVCLSALVPLCIMIATLQGSVESGFTAMYLMHAIGMVLLPVILIVTVFNDLQYYRVWLSSQLHHTPWRLKRRAILLALFGVVFVYVTTEIFLSSVLQGARSPHTVYHKIVRDFDPSKAYNIFSIGWFIFVNPLFEEFFWRVYLLKELGDRYFHHEHRAGPLLVETEQLSQESLNRSLISSSLRSRSPEHLLSNETLRAREDAYLVEDHVKDVRVSCVGQALVAAFYVSYHVAVLADFSGDPLICAAGALELWIYGMLFGMLRLDSRFGWWSAVGLHTGLDAALMLNFLLDYWEKK